MASTAGTGYPLIPKQKHRRSARRSGLRCRSLDAALLSPSALGCFQTLPLEIFQMVLNYLSGEELRVKLSLPISEKRHKSFPLGKAVIISNILAFSWLKLLYVIYSLNFQLLCMENQMTKI